AASRYRAPGQPALPASPGAAARAAPRRSRAASAPLILELLEARERLLRVLRASELLIRLSELVLHVGVGGGEARRDLEMLDRVGGGAAREQDLAGQLPGVGVLRPRFADEGELRQRLRLPLVEIEHGGQRVARPQVVG